MRTSIRFLLNGTPVETVEESGLLLVDWLRRDRGLVGTKVGCREGDCGACAVLVGQRPAETGRSVSGVEWVPAASCLLALGELDGRHVVSVEGLASAGPTEVMKVLHDDNSSQCGFCSPGIVVAITARLLEGASVDDAALAAALEGNLCRCTGYAAIRRSTAKLAARFASLPADPRARLAALVAGGVLPAALAASMESLPEPARGPDASAPGLVLGGGTDWFVRHADEAEAAYALAAGRPADRDIRAQADGSVAVGGAASLRDFFASPLVRAAAPGIEAYADLFASPVIRSRATLAGNVANASPVADATAMLLALGAKLRLEDRKSGARRELPLDAFYLGYKKTAAAPDEAIRAVLLPAPKRGLRFAFEKASRRLRLDISAVNAGLSCVPDGAWPSVVLRDVRLSAGGVAAVPALLPEVAAFLEGKRLDSFLVREAAARARASVDPISDARGSADYRRDLTERLVIALFLRLFPEAKLEEELFA